MDRGPKIYRSSSSTNHSKLVYFCLFILVNAFLAYVKSPIEVKLWVGLFGLGTPLLIATRATPAATKMGNPWQGESFSIPSNLILLFILFSAAFVRLYKMNSLSVWPMWDEGHYASLAINLEEDWRFQFFFGSQQYMPVYTWIQALFFKAFGPSLLTMWLYPVLYSILLIPLAYGAARQFFSKNISFLYALLWGFSFWPIYLSKFATDISLCLIWQHLNLILLASSLRSLTKPGEESIKKIALLGFMIGIGWYFSKFWISSIVVYLFVIPYFLVLRRRFKPLLHLSFLVALLVPLLPMGFLMMTHRYGAHILSYLSLENSRSNWMSHIVDSLSYFTALFWGPLDKGYFCFGPLWGGFLNPLLASCFLLALVELWRWRRKTLIYFLFPILMAYLTQGFLSNNMEDMRIAPILPPLLLITAFGIQTLLQLAGKRLSVAVLAGLMACSFALDLHHLIGPYHSWAVPSQASGTSKPPEQYRAFLALEGQNQKEGPGLILEEFVHNVFNQTLLVATYPFNAARNPHLHPEQASWAGVVASSTFEKDFPVRFPGARKVPLSEGLSRHDEALDLWIIPIQKNASLFQRWARTNRLLQSFYDDIPYDVAGGSYQKVIQELLDHYMDFQGDPFLEPSFWSKIAEYAWEGKNPALTLEAGQKVLQSGHPRSRLVYLMGRAHLMMGDYSAAKKDFLMAGDLNPEYEPPEDQLNWLHEMAGKSGMNK